MSRREYFDRYAHRWDKICHLDTNEKLQKLVQSFELKRDSRVLDLGCGTGILFPHIIKSIGVKGMLFGVDFSQKMLLQAKRKFKDKSIVLLCSPAEELPFLSKFFDYVIAFACFPHFQNKNRAMGEISRVLKKGGKLFIAHLLSRKELKEHHCLAGGSVACDCLPSEKILRKMMENNGFKKIIILDQPSLYIACGVK